MSQAQNQIRFALLAITENRKKALQRRLAELEPLRGEPGVDSHIAEIQSDIRDEEALFERWRLENQRRRHNYVPFTFNLLKQLAKKGVLTDLVKRGEEITKEKHKRAREAAEKEKKATTGAATTAASSTTQK